MRGFLWRAAFWPLAVYQDGGAPLDFSGGGGDAVKGILGDIPIIGGILSGIASLFGLGGGAMDAVRHLASWTQTAFAWTGALAQNLWNAAHYLLDSLWRWVKFIYESVIKRLLTAILRGISKAHDWLEAHLRPVVNFLKKLRAWYDRYYKLYVRPWMNMLQHIRQVLAVLRALHIHWAAELDKRILQIESYTAGIFTQVRTILNGFIDIFNSVIDPLMMLRKPIIVLSLRRTILAMLRLGTGRPPGYFFPSPRKGAAHGLGILPPGMNFADPQQNPPASSYLGSDDGLGLFNGFQAGQPPDNSSVDDAQPLDYFNDDLWPDPNCPDGQNCYASLISGMRSRLASSS